MCHELTLHTNDWAVSVRRWWASCRVFVNSVWSVVNAHEPVSVRRGDVDKVTLG